MYHTYHFAFVRIKDIDVRTQMTNLASNLMPNVNANLQQDPKRHTVPWIDVHDKLELDKTKFTVAHATV